jgi:hypothetical protein
METKMDVFYQDTKTSKVFKRSRPSDELTAKIKSGDLRLISEDEFEALDDAQTGSATVGQLTKRIFATVSLRDFTNFEGRCIAEGVPLDKAFAMLVSQYGAGAVLTKVSKKAATRFNYLAEKGAVT